MSDVRVIEVHKNFRCSLCREETKNRLVLDELRTSITLCGPCLVSAYDHHVSRPQNARKK